MKLSKFRKSTVKFGRKIWTAESVGPRGAVLIWQSERTDATPPTDPAAWRFIGYGATATPRTGSAGKLSPADRRRVNALVRRIAEARARTTHPGELVECVRLLAGIRPEHYPDLLEVLRYMARN